MCLIDDITNDLASVTVNVGVYSYKLIFWKMFKALVVGSLLQYGVYTCPCCMMVTFFSWHLSRHFMMLNLSFIMQRCGHDLKRGL